MPNLTLKALVIDAVPSTVEELRSAYGSEFDFESIEYVNSVLKAIQSFMTLDFNICFIGEKFSPTDVSSFFSDYRKISKPHPCVFVQFRSQVDLDFDRTSLRSTGFDTVISKVGDHRDKTALWDGVKLIIEKKERDDTLERLDDIVENLIEEVNRVALQRKRGAQARLSTIYSNFLKDSAQRFAGLADRFFSKLMDSSEGSSPFETTEVDIPDSVLAKNLPHLKKDRYKGQSHRVWERLLNKHGVGGNSKRKVEEPVEADQPEPEKVD